MTWCSICKIKRVVLILLSMLCAVVYLIRRLFPRRIRVPVLVYHRTSPEDVCEEKYWNVDPRHFDQQLKYLSESTYSFISLEDLHQYIAQRAFPCERVVCITFDDGYLDNYNYALPLIQGHEAKTSFFVSTKYIGSNGPYPFLRVSRARSEQSVTPMGMHHIEEMQKHNVSFYSHGHEHTHYSDLSADQMRTEIAASLVAMDSIQQQGERLRAVAIPYGVFGDQAEVLTKILKDMQFQCAFLGRWGSVTDESDLLDLPRLPIYGTDSLFEFHLKVNGAYDWISVVQKYMKNR